MTLLFSDRVSQMELLLGKFGLDRLTLEIIANTEVDNFLLFVGGSRLWGLHKRDADIDMHGVYVPPAHELTGFDIQTKVVEHKFQMPSENGRVMLDVSVTLMPVQRAMGMAHALEGNIWTNMSLIARHQSDWLVHEQINKDGGYNLLSMFEDTAARMVPHLPRYAFEGHYYGMAKSYRAQIKKELLANDPTRLHKLISRFSHVLAMWRDSRVQWPVGMTDAETLRQLDHAVPLASFKRFETILDKERDELMADVDAELESVNNPNLKPVEADVEKFRVQFKKLVVPALRRLYKV